MDLQLANQVALVTGSSRGLGRAIAAALLDEGARVMLCARNAGDLEITRAELAATGGDRVAACVADVTRPEDRQRLVQETCGRLGPITVLVHNAGGGGSSSSALQTHSDEWEQALNLNVWSGLDLTRLVVPHMRGQGGGAILFIASIWGREKGGRPAYNLAKASEISLAKSLARELAPWNIRVNSLAPGSILFPGGSWEQRRRADPEGIAAWLERDFPFKRFGKPEEVGSVAAFLCSPRASWITGACLPVDGGQSHSQV